MIFIMFLFNPTFKRATGGFPCKRVFPPTETVAVRDTYVVEKDGWQMESVPDASVLASGAGGSAERDAARRRRRLVMANVGRIGCALLMAAILFASH